MSQQLTVLAEKAEFHGRKNEVIERALMQLLEGKTSDTVLLSVHDHLHNFKLPLKSQYPSCARIWLIAKLFCNRRGAVIAPRPNFDG